MLNLRGNKITWFGHSAFRIDTATGNVVLVDPWLSGNPKAPKDVSFERVDTICLTHAHGDHLGDTVALARKHKQSSVHLRGTFVAHRQRRREYLPDEQGRHAARERH